MAESAKTAAKTKVGPAPTQRATPAVRVDDAKVTERPIKYRTVTAPSLQGCRLVVLASRALEPGEAFDIDRPTTVIGRSSECDLCFDEDHVSRNHCQLVNTGAEILLRDLDSLNGTFVNGEVIHARALRDGDEVWVGQVLLKVLIGEDLAARPGLSPDDLDLLDPLTGALDEPFFLERLELEVERSQQGRRPQAISLLALSVGLNIRPVDPTALAVGRLLISSLRTLLSRHAEIGRGRRADLLILLPRTDRAAAGQIANAVRRQHVRISTYFAPQAPEPALGVASGRGTRLTAASLIAKALRSLEGSGAALVAPQEPADR